MPTPRTKRPSPYEAARPLPSLWLRDDMDLDNYPELPTHTPHQQRPPRPDGEPRHKGQ